jgi:lysophospholipase L1-like esterase
MRVWLAVRQYNIQSLPRPLDAPRVCVPGVSSTRVLIFGSGVAVGWGVTSHELALPGALARALTSRSGRGADVEVHADMRITARNALSVLRGLDVESYDVIVVVLGANDAVAQTALERWWNGLSAILEHLESRSAQRTQLFVAGIPPIALVPGFGGTVGAIAAAHAEKINRATQRLCEQWGRATFLPLPLAEGRTADRFGDGRTYRTWAVAMAEVIAPLLHSARWGRHDSLPRESALDEDRIR